MPVDRINPADLFWPLDGSMSRLTTTASLSLRTRTHSSGVLLEAVDFLVWHIRRNEDEVARVGFGDVVEMVAPAHPRGAPENIDHALGVTVVMGAVFASAWICRARPDF